ncbi:MAG: CRISPR-associated endonuclease Cas2 [Thermoleophilia bacterium]|nr:CRISPR-associated endonuclease Cas2 [Thermoleophilia bacterium]
MMVLVTYDVNTENPEGKKRLAKVARICSDWGQRVQKSVFECVVDPAQWEQLRAALVRTINPELDSIRFYFLGSNWRRRVEHIGVDTAWDPEGLLFF